MIIAGSEWFHILNSEPDDSPRVGHLKLMHKDKHDSSNDPSFPCRHCDHVLGTFSGRVYHERKEHTHKFICQYNYSNAKHFFATQEELDAHREFVAQIEDNLWGISPQS